MVFFIILRNAQYFNRKKYRLLCALLRLRRGNFSGRRDCRSLYHSDNGFCLLRRPRGDRARTVHNGFDLPLTRAVADAVDIPVIASGGVGNLQHLADGVSLGGADAVLAASIFHFGEYTVRQAKEFMRDQGIEVRL